MAMMDNWRTGQNGGRSYKQQHGYQRTGSSFNKRAQYGSWNTSVPSWEKKFCSTIGTIPWRTFLEMKEYSDLPLYDNINQWNDSASKEAFDNAKHKFWADINGQPCDISFPGPDIHIDDIDWNSEVDPELILDLEREPDIEDGEEEEVTVDCNTLLLNQPVECTGWGDEEEFQDKGVNADSAVVYDWEKDAIYNQNAWENSCPRSYGNGNDSWRGSNNWGSQNFDGRIKTWNPNYQKYEEDNGRQMSRYKTSRFHGDNYQTSRFHGDNYQTEQRLRNNGKWREPYNRVRQDQRPISRQWKMSS